MAFGKSFQIILHLASITGVLYCELMMVSTSSLSDTTAHNLFANHRPRFKIPKGNLSYYRRPHWEILYFMKYGTFPFYASSSVYLNRAQFINKMRAIKHIFDRQASEEESGEYNNNLSRDEQNETSGLNVADPVSAENFKQNQVGNNNMYYPPNHLLTPQEMEENIRTKKPYASKKNVDVAGLRDRFPSDYRTGPIVVDLNANTEDRSGISDEVTIHRMVGRQFQTQGWK